MLANKLKNKLKNIKTSGREDHDIVINLSIVVKSIVKSLTEMGMQEMLKYDDEYLAAIFRVLSAQHRIKLLEFDKSKGNFLCKIGQILKLMARVTGCSKNPEIFFGCSSYIYTAMDKLPG